MRADSRGGLGLGNSKMRSVRKNTTKTQLGARRANVFGRFYVASLSERCQRDQARPQGCVFIPIDARYISCIVARWKVRALLGLLFRISWSRPQQQRCVRGDEQRTKWSISCFHVEVYANKGRVANAANTEHASWRTLVSFRDASDYSIVDQAPPSLIFR